MALGDPFQPVQDLEGLLGQNSDFLTGTQGSVGYNTMGTMSPQQQQLFKVLQQAMLNKSNAGIGLSLTGLDEYIKKMSTGGPTAMDKKYVQKGISEPLTQNLKSEILPAISRRYGQSGFYGSERLKSDRDAVSTTQDTIASKTAEYYGGRQAGREQNLLSALSSRGQLQLGAAGAEMAPYQVLAQILGITQQENFATALPGQPGALQGILGGLAGGAGAGLGFGLMR